MRTATAAAAAAAAWACAPRMRRGGGATSQGAPMPHSVQVLRFGVVAQEGGMCSHEKRTVKMSV